MDAFRPLSGADVPTETRAATTQRSDMAVTVKTADPSPGGAARDVSTRTGAMAQRTDTEPRPVDRERLAWATIHERMGRLRGAQWAQITRHHDLDGGRDAIGQQLAWARRQAHEQRLHDSAMEHLRHRR